MEHPWFGVLLTASAASSAAAVKNIKGSLERFINMNKLKRTALEVIAEQLTEAELVGLRATFEALDTNHDGKLTYAELTRALEQQVMIISIVYVMLVGCAMETSSVYHSCVVYCMLTLCYAMIVLS